VRLSRPADGIPLILDGARVHFIRYSANPFIVTWNTAGDVAADVLVPGPAPAPGVHLAEARGVEYELTRTVGSTRSVACRVVKGRTR
jgi:hypothetical protein